MKITLRFCNFAIYASFVNFHFYNVINNIDIFIVSCSVIEVIQNSCNIAASHYKNHPCKTPKIRIFETIKLKNDILYVPIQTGHLFEKKNDWTIV